MRGTGFRRAPMGLLEGLANGGGHKSPSKPPRLEHERRQRPGPFVWVVHEPAAISRRPRSDASDPCGIPFRRARINLGDARVKPWNVRTKIPRSRTHPRRPRTNLRRVRTKLGRAQTKHPCTRTRLRRPRTSLQRVRVRLGRIWKKLPGSETKLLVARGHLSGRRYLYGRFRPRKWITFFQTFDGHHPPRESAGETSPAETQRRRAMRPRASLTPRLAQASASQSLPSQLNRPGVRQ